jgi:hypothetical protein
MMMAAMTMMVIDNGEVGDLIHGIGKGGHWLVGWYCGMFNYITRKDEEKEANLLSITRVRRDAISGASTTSFSSVCLSVYLYIVEPGPILDWPQNR